MAITLSLSTVTQPDPADRTLKQIIYYGAVIFSGNYGGASTHGDTFNVSSLGIQSGALPTRVEVYEEPPAGTAPTGYVFIFAKGTTPYNGVLCVMQCGGAAAPFSELTEASAYPAALTATAPAPIIKFAATFPYGL